MLYRHDERKHTLVYKKRKKIDVEDANNLILNVTKFLYAYTFFYLVKKLTRIKTKILHCNFLNMHIY